MRFFIISICLVINFNSFSQCTGTTQFPLNTVSASNYSDTITISLKNYAGQYAIINNLDPNETYEFTSSSPGDYFTIRNAYDHSILLAHGPAPLSYSPTSEDIISLHIHLTSPPCGVEEVFRTTKVYCTTCSPLPSTVGVHTLNPTASLDINGEIKIGDSSRPPEAGMIRWNDDISDFEGYNGSKWISLTKSNQEGQWGVLPTNEVNPDFRLIANDGSASDRFGQSVSIDGDYIIIGARYDDIGDSTNQGSAYIFHRNESAWVQQAKLVANDGFSQDQLGHAVDISGDYAIVGARYDDVGANVNQGSAYIFHRTGNNWTQQAKLIASDGASSDFFGISVDLHGDYAIVGASIDNVGANINQGSAYIFYRNGSNWTQQAKLTAGDGASSDYFGTSVDLHGDYAIVGANNDTVGVNAFQGSAYIFKRSGVNWAEESKLTATDGAPGDLFGTSVSIDGEYAIVGANFDDVGANFNQGSAYIFERNGTIWTEQVKLSADDGVSEDRFGNSVSIFGNDVIVGSSSADVSIGSAYVFQRSGIFWTQHSKIVRKFGKTGEQFGHSVGLSENDVVIGAVFEIVGSNPDQGAAYIISRK